MKRVLISVSDKSGLAEFARGLSALGWEIVSTGGTKKFLDENGLKTIGISELTKFPEIMDGRVKTLHPAVHGGLLCVRSNPEHVKALDSLGLGFIDMVVVNLYPFKNTLAKGAQHEELIENIDIGGPSMIRSASKNYQSVTVAVDPRDYPLILSQLQNEGDTTPDLRERLAAKAFRHTAAYDALIADYLTGRCGEAYPDTLTLTYEKVQDLRYGENPHQSAAFYRTPLFGFSLASGKQLHGKELSYNNIQDANAALEILKEFSEACVVAVKHMNPCGIGTGSSIEQAWAKAYEADPTSIFGGIIACNRPVSKEAAEGMGALFLEIIIAPSFSPEAFAILSQKKNIRLMELAMDSLPLTVRKTVSVLDGLLVQDRDNLRVDAEGLKCVTKKIPTEGEIASLLFAWKAVKHVKSNAIVVASEGQTLGIGAGQMNRVGAAKIALEQAGGKAKGAVLASDAFFPMPDTVELAAQCGISAIIQPGGSLKDKESIEACDRHGIAMVFTGARHFKH